MYCFCLTCRNPEELLIEDQEVARKKRRKNKGKDDVQEEEPQPKKTKRDEADEATSSEPTVTSPMDVAVEDAEQLVTESTEMNGGDEASGEAKKKKKKKRKNKNALVETNSSADKPAAATEEVNVSQSNQSPEKTKQNKKEKWAAKKTKKAASVDFRSEMTDERLKAYGFNPKKIRNQIKYGKASQSWLVPIFPSL